MRGALVVQANAQRLPLRDATADLVVTSPPYLWKRKYAIDGTGEMGNEANWRLFLDNLFAATDEMLRALKPTGSIFVNLGDTRVTGREPKWLGIPIKSRLLLPERYRVGCQDRYAAQGVAVRQVQIWEKTNGLPESTTDRTRDSHEDWVQLVKRPNYYSAIDEVREPHSAHTLRYYGPGVRTEPRGGKQAQRREEGAWHPDPGGTGLNSSHPLGKLPGSVWAVPSEPLRLPAWLGVDHYAAFPGELVRRLVLAFSPPGICLDCGQGRVPVVEGGRLSEEGEQLLNGRDSNKRYPAGAGRRDQKTLERSSGLSGDEARRYRVPATILGYACACTPFTDHPGSGDIGHRDLMAAYGDARKLSEQPRSGAWREYHLDRWTPPPTCPAVILDPFGGVGTTGMVARALGRIGLSFDLSHAYSRAARWRIWSDDAAKAISRTNLERQQVLL